MFKKCMKLYDDIKNTVIGIDLTNITQTQTLMEKSQKLIHPS